MKLNRRDFLKLGSAMGAALTAGSSSQLLAGEVVLKEGGHDFSPETGKERKAIPSACWQCVARDAIVCHVEDGKAVKIEGNSESIRNRGKICAKGQAGINQIYDPDRVLYPMKRKHAKKLVQQEILRGLRNGWGTR